MNKKHFTGIFFYAGLIGAYCITIVIMFIFLDSIVIRNSIVTRYQVECIAFNLIESFRQNRLAEYLADTEQVKGFGIYDHDGNKIFTSGNAPEIITPEDFTSNKYFTSDIGNNTCFVFNNKFHTLQLTRPIMNMQGRGMLIRQMMLGNNTAPAYVFLEHDIAGYWKSHNLINTARITLPVFMLFIICLIAYLYKKNRNYKAHLAGNAELIKLGEISRTLAHEIKNPLSAIRLQTGILKKSDICVDNEEVRIIEEEVQRLEILTSHISDFLRDPAGNPEKIQLEPFLRALIRRFDFDIRIINSTNHDVSVLFDRNRLRSVLENIIKNGIESYHCLTTNEAQYLEIRIAAVKGKVLLSIIDQGIGMDKVHNPGNSNKETGFGIGLAIAARFMEAQGGSLEPLHREGGGTEVKVAFA